MGCGNSGVKENIGKDKNKVIFVLGGPGSGKGTQCSQLVKKYDFQHISTGDLLRDEQKNNGPNADYIRETLASGGLVKSDILVELIKRKLEKVNNKLFLLDGFPRSFENIESWNKIINNTIDPPFVLYFNCSKETMKKRILKRAETSGRSDDNEEAINKRLNVFEEQTIPVVENYKKEDKVIEVNCENDADDVFKETIKFLKIKMIL